VGSCNHASTFTNGDKKAKVTGIYHTGIFYSKELLVFSPSVKRLLLGGGEVG